MHALIEAINTELTRVLPAEMAGRASQAINDRLTDTSGHVLLVGSLCSLPGVDLNDTHAVLTFKGGENQESLGAFIAINKGDIDQQVQAINTALEALNA